MPEPYKGKGMKFVGEEIRRKSGKTAAAKQFTLNCNCYDNKSRKTNKN